MLPTGLQQGKNLPQIKTTRYMDALRFTVGHIPSQITCIQKIEFCKRLHHNVKKLSHFLRNLQNSTEI